MTRVALAGFLVAATVVAASSPSAAQAPQVADYSQEAFVYEQVRTSIRFENDGTGRRESYMRVRTQSDAGVKAFGQLVLGYNAANERAEIAFVRVRKPDGSVIVTPADAVQDLSAPVQRVAPIYTDYRQKHVTVQSLRPSDVLELNLVTTVHTALAPGQFWLEHDFEHDAVVLDEQLEIDLPSTRSPILKLGPGFETTPTTVDGRRVYRWSRSQLKGVAARKADEDERAKKPAADADELSVAPIRLTTFQSWEDVGRWYRALEAPQRTPTPEVRKKAAELIAGRQNDLEKLDALYEFVATNFRYVSLSLGVGRYQPRSAAAVLQEQYGDCKDKHTLLASLIEAAGFEAWGVLVNLGSKVDPAFPSPSQFNHVITLAKAGDHEVWLDTTSEVAPFQLLLPALRNQEGLVVDGSGSRLRRTPANPPARGLMDTNIEARLDGTGKLEGHVRMAVRGDVEFLLRTLFRGGPEASRHDVLQQFVKGLGLAAEIANEKIADPAALRVPFTLAFDFTAPRYVEWTAKRAAVPLPLTTSGAGPTPSEEGTTAVNLGAPTDLSYTLRMTLPPEVSGRPPLPVALSRDYASYRAGYAIADNVLTAERVMKIQLSEVPAERRQDVIAFLRVVTADAAQTLSLETSGSIAPAATDGGTKEQLLRRGAAALNAGNHAEALVVFQRVIELDAKDRFAWNQLGRAQMGMRQTDAAIESFQKQIAINPYDQYSYNNLGLAYVAKGEFDKAEAAYLKQLDVNPLDKVTSSNLGALYLQRHRYEPAAEQFEKGIALNPDNSWLYYQAGKAYLNLKQVDKATAAFDRAVALSPTPGTWNNIAYELAVSGLQLDRAQQYAESAVASVAAASRNLDISRADAQALSVVRSLGMYWDTLGWVYYARRDLAKAAPLIEMAWRLNQHGEVGDHLGQVYEAQGRRTDAIEAYARALASMQPPDEARTRLAALLGSDSKVDAVVQQHRERLASLRTIAIPGKTSTQEAAEFLVLFATPGTVEQVRFLSGADSLRPFADTIRTTAFGRMFPDDAPAKLLRLAQLSCSPATGCALTLVLPEDARPLK